MNDRIPINLTEDEKRAAIDGQPATRRLDAPVRAGSGQTDPGPDGVGGPYGGHYKRPPGVLDEMKGQPIMGWLAVISGLLGIFTIAIPFVPLALLFSIIALIKGQPFWAVAGLLLTVAGVGSSPILFSLLGLGAFFAMFGF